MYQLSLKIIYSIARKGQQSYSHTECDNVRMCLPNCGGKQFSITVEKF